MFLHTDDLHTHTFTQPCASQRRPARTVCNKHVFVWTLLSISKTVYKTVQINMLFRRRSHDGNLNHLFLLFNCVVIVPKQKHSQVSIQQNSEN